ncbi:hypothetical protein [Gordonia sp. UBA7599]|uniref:hypothetical protein n=1 Tax=unclassified Gordonia (in: high G+C Gram-positive bacteria) TaxID=2657482 RepID=UPI000FAF720B|nr:hypothetical protein [Gordonia sp. UBA7599]RUP38838.1 MAG: hypothetical protein EKK60_08600 [Gordonia sp. (in: high G+C Gram-positive bacteria)]HNP58418.1 hypothetical protein [Gordonia sp. (in: high G+C Gram-positive bacteria)]
MKSTVQKLAWELSAVLRDHFGEDAMFAGNLGTYMMDLTEGEHEYSLGEALSIAVEESIAVPHSLLVNVRAATAEFHSDDDRRIVTDRLDKLMPQAA